MGVSRHYSDYFHEPVIELPICTIRRWPELRGEFLYVDKGVSSFFLCSLLCLGVIRGFSKALRELQQQDFLKRSEMSWGSWDLLKCS